MPGGCLNAINTLAGGGGTAIEDAGYIAYADLDRDGDIDGTDYSIASAEGTHVKLANGVRTDPSVDNIIGFDGYIFNSETKQCQVRYRNYDPEFGRWLERDLAEYISEHNLYSYVKANPGAHVDPLGLFPIGGQMQCVGCRVANSPDGSELFGYYLGCPRNTDSFKECVVCAHDRYLNDLDQCKEKYPKPPSTFMYEVIQCKKKHPPGEEFDRCVLEAKRRLDRRDRLWNLDRTGCESFAGDVLERTVAKCERLYYGDLSAPVEWPWICY